MTESLTEEVSRVAKEELDEITKLGFLRGAWFGSLIIGIIYLIIGAHVFALAFIATIHLLTKVGFKYRVAKITGTKITPLVFLWSPRLNMAVAQKVLLERAEKKLRPLKPAPPHQYMADLKG